MCLWFQAKIFWVPAVEKGTSIPERALDLKVPLEIREEGGGGQISAEEERAKDHQT